MPRLFVGNFEFEHSLANASYQVSVTLARLNAELAVCWLAIAQDGDFLWCPQPIGAEFFERMATKRLPRVIPVSNLANVPAGVELIPWGWDERWLQRARAHQWSDSAPDPSVVRQVNSRKFSFELESAWSVGLPGAAMIHDAGQVDAALNRTQEFSSRTVIKANWGMSGRERILVAGPLSDSQRGWLRKRVAEQQVVFVEPWIDRVEELGIQIQISATGPPVLIGVTPLICDAAGQYRGNWCTEPPDHAGDFAQRWQPAVQIALAAAQRMQLQGYWGPVGIDAMRYRQPDGTVAIRPLQDINARWTMGRLSLGWRRILAPGERAYWQHAVTADLTPPSADLRPPVRVIETSPSEIDGLPVEHRSRLWIYGP